MLRSFPAATFPDLKDLKLPTFLRECHKIADLCGKERTDYQGLLLRLVEREIQDREVRARERRIKAAKLPVIKTLDSFDFKAQSSINPPLVRELMSGEYIGRRESVLLIGNSGNWDCVGDESRIALVLFGTEGGTI